MKKNQLYYEKVVVRKRRYGRDIMYERWYGQEIDNPRVVDLKGVVGTYARRVWGILDWIIQRVLLCAPLVLACSSPISWNGAALTNTDETSCARSCLEDVFTMVCERVGIRCEFFGDGEWCAGLGSEGGTSELGLGGRQGRGEHQAKMFVEGDQALVEGFVVEGVEGDAVSGVQAHFGVLGPRNDVASDEESLVG